MIGLAIGIAAAMAIQRVLASFSQLLYGVGASDPETFAVASLLLAGVVILACIAPARGGR